MRHPFSRLARSGNPTTAYRVRFRFNLAGSPVRVSPAWGISSNQSTWDPGDSRDTAQSRLRTQLQNAFGQAFPVQNVLISIGGVGGTPPSANHSVTFDLGVPANAFPPWWLNDDHVAEFTARALDAAGLNLAGMDVARAQFGRPSQVRVGAGTATARYLGTDSSPAFPRSVIVAFLVEATPTTRIGAATSEEIRLLFQRVTPRVQGFSWIGPAPRVTRQATETQSITRAVWLAEYPVEALRTTEGASLPQTVAAALQGAFNGRSVVGAGGPWRASASAYNGAINGPLDFWRGGQAANTRTRESFPSAVSQFAEQDNPFGPTTAHTRPGTAADVVEESLVAAQRGVEGVGQTVQRQASATTEGALRPVQDTLSTVKTIAILGAVIAIPIAATLFFTSARGIVRDVRANPRKRRRRR